MFVCPTHYKYLGHIISSSVAPDEQKTYAVINWSVPASIKQLMGFLGLTVFYRIFIKNYASIAYTLTELLKKKTPLFGIPNLSWL